MRSDLPHRTHGPPGIYQHREGGLCGAAAGFGGRRTPNCSAAAATGDAL